MDKERTATPNNAIKEYITSGETPTEWKYRDTVTFLYRVFDTARFAFFSQRDETQLPRPQSVIAIEDMRYQTLAAYRISYNETGLPFQISMNAKWLDRPQWELCESLVHESVHLYQEYMADQKVAGMEHCRNGYHNKQFVDLCEDIGHHPLLGVGAHWKPADGQFEGLMNWIGVEKPEYAKEKFDKPEGPVKGSPYWWDGVRGKSKGTSSLVLYTADGCTREPVCKVRAGRRDLQLNCGGCGNKFHPHG